MNEIPAVSPIEIGPPVQNRPGCARTGLFVVAILLTLGLSIAFLSVEWTIEQLLFDGELGFGDIRPWVVLAFAIVILVLLILLAVALPAGHYRRIYRSWLWAAVPLLLTLPARFLALSDAQGILAVDLIGLLVYLLILRLANRGGRRPTNRSASGYAITLGLAGLIMLPWVVWGSLGSAMDIVLDLAVGLVFGLAAMRTVANILDSRDQAAYSQFGPYGNFEKLIGVLIAFGLLAGGITPVGLQPYLPAIIAALSLVVVGMSRWGAASQKRVGQGALALLLGLAAATVLLWVDGDELMFVITGTPGDLSGYAVRMLAISLLVILAAGILALVTANRMESWQGDSSPMAILPIGIWIAVAVLYIFAGQPGLYGERLFVILKDQADLTQAASIADASQRRQAVFNDLVAEAETGQASLRTGLQRWNIAYTPFYLENAMEINGGPLVRLWLETRPEVAEVLDSPHLRPLNGKLGQSTGTQTAPSSPDWNLTMIHADQVWQDLGVRGAGIVVGQSDSGVQGDHSELADGYLGADGSNDYHWLDPWFGTTSPTDWEGHGTHTLSTAIGNSVGVAPDASWIACTNLARNLGDPAYYLTCMQFMFAPYPQKGNAFVDGDPSRGANVLNNSWGCPPVEGCVPDTFDAALKALKTAGVFVVASAGNSGLGGCGSVDAPIALNADAFTVGAVTSTGQLANFSSIGPVTVDGSNRLKPEILAPGDGVLSAFPGNTYEVASGTSMAGPHLVGVVALMWSANPALIGQVDVTARIIESTAQPYDGSLPACVVAGKPPENGIGYGIVDAYGAVKAAMDY